MSTESKPLAEKDIHARLLPTLVFAALSVSVVSSLGMLLVPTIAHEMNVGVSTAQWMLTINLLVGAISTPILGRLSDGPHKKRLLMWSLACILVGSVLAALAPNFSVFLIGRALQGLTYGIVPITISLARRYLAGNQARAGISSLSVTVATGLGIGYPLTGILASLLNYRFAFWFAALFLICAIAVIRRVVPDGPDSEAPRAPFDFTGAVLIGIGLSTLLLAVSEGSGWGWSSPRVIGLFCATAVVMAVWSVVELRTLHPLINLRVLRNADVLVANATAIALGVVMYIGLSIVSLIAQAPTTTGYGIAMPLFWAGFVLLPLSVGSFGANRMVRRVAHRVPMRALLLVGSGLFTASSIHLWLDHNSLWEILIGTFGFGVGMGTTYAAIPALIARSVARTELGSAVSFNQVLRTVGGALGSALSGAVLAAHMGSDMHPTSHGIQLALGIGAIGSVVVFTTLIINHVMPKAKGHDQGGNPSGSSAQKLMSDR